MILTLGKRFFGRCFKQFYTQKFRKKILGIFKLLSWKHKLHRTVPLVKRFFFLFYRSKLEIELNKGGLIFVKWKEMWIKTLKRNLNLNFSSPFMFKNFVSTYTFQVKQTAKIV